MASKYPFSLSILGMGLGVLLFSFVGAHWWDYLGIYIASWLMIFGPLRKKASPVFIKGLLVTRSHYPVVYGYIVAITVKLVLEISRFGDFKGLGQIFLILVFSLFLFTRSGKTAEAFFTAMEKKER